MVASLARRLFSRIRLHYSPDDLDHGMKLPRHLIGALAKGDSQHYLIFGIRQHFNRLFDAVLLNFARTLFRDFRAHVPPRAAYYWRRSEACPSTFFVM